MVGRARTLQMATLAARQIRRHTHVYGGGGADRADLDTAEGNVVGVRVFGVRFAW